MKLTPVATLLLFILSTTLPPAQSQQSTKGADAPKTIRVSTDSLVTAVETVPQRTRLYLGDREVPDLKMYLQVVAEFPASRAGLKPETVTLYFRNLSDPDLTFNRRADRVLWFTADGERVQVGHLEQVDMKGIGGASEWLQITVLYEDFLKIAESKHVAGRLGSFAFELTEDQRKVFRDFIKAVTPK